MIEVLRRNQRILWIVIGVLAIPFIFYFVEQPTVGVAGANYGQVGDRKITQAEMQRGVRLMQLAQQLGMFRYLQDTIAQATSEDDAYLRFTATRILLDDEYKELGIEPSPAEIANVVREFPAFQTNGQFDLGKYSQFVQNALGPLGFNEGHIEELAADQWSLDRLKQLIGVGINIPEGESRRNFEQAYGKMDVVVARFDKEQLEKELQVSDEEINKFYEARKDTLKSEERRKVEVASMVLSDEQKKLTGKERIDVLQRLANTAGTFMEELSAPDVAFGQVAARHQVPVQTTEEFTVSEPPPLLKDTPELLQAVARLTPQQPNSDIVQTRDGFYVAHLAEFKPAQPLSLEEARPKIVEQIKTNQVRTRLAANATAAAQQLRDQLKSGATAEAAMTTAGLKPERVPPFAFLEEPTPTPAPTPVPSPAASPPAASPAASPGDSPTAKAAASPAASPVASPEASPKTAPDESPAASPGASPAASPAPSPEPETPDLDAIKSAVAQLNPGEVSPFIPTEKGGILAVLEKRQPVTDPALEPKREMLDRNVLEQQRNIVFYEWLKQTWEDRKIVLPTMQPEGQQQPIPAGG